MFARRAPDEWALITISPQAGEERLSWKELDRRTRELAASISAAAAALPGSTPAWIPILNTLDHVVLVLAALRTNQIVVPVDGNAPEHHREQLLDTVTRYHGGVVPLAHLAEGPPGSSGDRRTEPRGIASEGGYLLLTGGTTGAATAVLWPGQPSWYPGAPPLTLRQAQWREGQTQLVVGPLNHAAPFRHLLDGLLSGNQMVLPSVYSPQTFLSAVEDHGVEWVQMTPLHMRMVDPVLESNAHRLTSLRAVLHTAAQCPSDTKHLWIQALGPEKVFEMYAATEGIGATFCRGDEWLRKPGTVGRGLLTRIRIYDEQLRLLPPGRVGMVFMRSVTSGRVQVPEREERSAPGGFRSVGDHGYLDEEGYLYLAGRADDLVTVGGHNVYLADIDAVLLEHPDVLDAAVVASPDDVFESHLNAYVSVKQGSSVDANTVLDHCRERLPSHQIPRTVSLVTKIPRNTAGKLLRGHLLSPTEVQHP